MPIVGTASTTCTRRLAVVMALATLGAVGGAEVLADAPGLVSPKPTLPVAPPPPAATTAAPAPSDSALAPAPPGFVRLYDDTGTLTVVVDERWTDVETHELDIDGGVPRIAAAPDEDAFQTDSADATGVNLLAQPFAPDPQAVIDQYSREEACQAFGTQPYDDGLRSGLVWLGTGCGASRQGTWSVVVASPADASVTFRVHLRTATAADQPAADMVMRTFGATVPGSVAPAALPPSPLPAGASPTDVAAAFLGALAIADGSAACSLLSAEYIDNFAGGLRTCADDLAADGGSTWATVQIVGDEFTSSDGCGDEDPADDFVSLELRGPSDDGCLAMGRVDGEWRIEDLSNSIWSQV